MTDTEKQEIISAIVQSATDLGTAPETSSTSDVDWLIALKGSNEPKRLSKAAFVASTTLEDTKSAITAALARKQDKLSTDGNFTLTANNLLQLTLAAKRAVFIDMWAEVGGSHNAAIDDGMFECLCYRINGIYLTYSQAIKTYRVGQCTSSEAVYLGESIVTNVPRTSYMIRKGSFLQHCGSLKVANIIFIKLGEYSFGGCKELTHIISRRAHDYPSTIHDSELGCIDSSLSLTECSKLEVVNIAFVNKAQSIYLDLSKSPNVTPESIHWMIEKAQATKVDAGVRDTIYLHPTAFANYKSNPYLGTATNHPIQVTKKEL